jgi:hypothetical protein
MFYLITKDIQTFLKADIIGKIEGPPSRNHSNSSQKTTQ